MNKIRSIITILALVSVIAGQPLLWADGTDSGSVGKAENLSPLLAGSFQTDLATGSATAGISITVPPGRKNMHPQIALSYSNNTQNGVCGVGWSLTGSSIQRSTKKGVPKYDSTDSYIFASSGSTGELILADAAENRYCQKIETSFMKYIYENANSRWLVYDKSGTKYIFGSTVNSRLTNGGGTLIFAWYLDRVEDVNGNAVLFTYEKDLGQIYLSKIEYTANDAVTPALSPDKKVDLIYETNRPDAITSNRYGWKIETLRRLKEIRVSVDNSLVWRYSLNYTASHDTGRSLLTQVTLIDASGNSFPPKKFTYQTIE